MSDFETLLQQLLSADDAACNAADIPVEVISECDSSPTKEPYCVEVEVVTRAGEIPVSGLTVTLDDAPLGTTDQDGKVGRSAPRTKPSFLVKVLYRNDMAHLKAEEVGVRVTGVSAPEGRYVGFHQLNFIDKIRDVAGTMDDRSFQDDFSTAKDEISYKDIGSDHVYHLKVRLATLSLNVPYYNQRQQSDGVTTSAEHDPEGRLSSQDDSPMPHRHAVPAIPGSYLCFPSSATMLLMYWGQSVTRHDVMQACYDIWAKTDFDGRLDSQAVVSTTEPIATCGYWLQAKLPIPDNGWTMYQNDGSDLEAMPETAWRVKQSNINIWEWWDVERQAIDQLAPDDTTAKVVAGNGAYSLQVGGASASVLARLKQGLPVIVSTTATAGHIMVVRGAVVRSDCSIAKLIVNDPYGTLESPKSLYHDLNIQHDVGEGALNDAMDVEQVQAALYAINFYSGDIDGNCSGEDEDSTVVAIKTFQKQQLHLKQPDGRIDGGGQTEKKLEAAAKKKAHEYKTKGEKNDAGASGDGATRGMHQYYDDETHGHKGKITLKGCPVVLIKDDPFSLPELTNKLTPNQ